VQLGAGKIWEKAPVGLSIVERRVQSPQPKEKERQMAFFFF